MNRRKFYISASSISSLICQSNYDIVTSFQKFWQKHDLAEYNRLMDTIKEELKEKAFSVEIIKQKINPTITEMKIVDNFEKKIETIELSSKDNVERISDVIPELITKEILESNDSIATKKTKLNALIVSKEHVSASQKNQLTKDISKLVNTSHGIVNEASVIDDYQTKQGTKIVIDTSQQLYSKLFHSSLTIDWYICGRIDGLCTNNDDSHYILEVKNRVKGFFANVRNYEQTQIQIYMWLLAERYNPQFSILEERFNGKSKSTRVYKDTKYTDSILDDLIQFTRCFEIFLGDASLKREFIETSEKTYFLNNLYTKYSQPHPIQSDLSNCMISDSDDDL